MNRVFVIVNGEETMNIFEREGRGFHPKTMLLLSLRAPLVLSDLY